MTYSSLHFEDFYSLVKKYFSFLQEAGFSEKSFDKSRSFRLYFSDKKMIVQIEYSRSSDFLDIRFRKDDGIEETSLYQIEQMLSLSEYLHARGYKKEAYAAILPRAIGFESSLKEMTLLVKNFAGDILLGDVWITDQMVKEGFMF